MNSMNVKDFGAVGDGITDDTKAIQDAINQCLNNPNPIRSLYLPGGTYKITDSLFILKIVEEKPSPSEPPQPCYTFVGLEIYGEKPSFSIEGQDTIIVATFNDKPAIIMQAVRAVTIKNLTIQGQNNYILSGANFDVLLDDSTFVVNGCRDSQYSPYAGICIDPYKVLPLPPDGGYPGQSYYYLPDSGTSGIRKRYIPLLSLSGFSYYLKFLEKSYNKGYRVR